MLKEYAIQPRLLTDWTTCRFLLDKFGYGQGRVVSRYPRRWERLVYESLSDERPLEKIRIVEALTRFKRALYPRHHEWDDSKPWIENALDEHGKRPFTAIVGCNDEMEHVALIKEDALDEVTELRWKAERQRRVARVAADMAACTTLLLRNAKHILFVDPHFNPQKERFRRPLAAFLRVIAKRQTSIPVDRIEIHCGHTSAGVKVAFDRDCRTHLPSIIPMGFKVRLIRWDQTHLHNRFILTESGGLKFGTGLDDQNGGNVSHDFVDLLEQDLHASTWQEYQSQTSAFPLFEDDLIIIGTA